MMQHTIKNTISVVGRTLHSGENVTLVLGPAPANTGIVFRRTDCDPVVSIKVGYDKIRHSLLCTTLVENKTEIMTIEHLLSALSGLEIDNLYVDTTGNEIPIMDGSAFPFVFLIESAGIVEQNARRKFLYIKKTVRVDEGDKFVEFSPANDYRLDISIDFDHPAIKATPLDVHFVFSPNSYVKEVARARTFGQAADLEKLQAQGLAKGAGLDNAIGLSDQGILNREGLRLKDEFVRHKLLDALGDLYIAGPIRGQFKASKPSHTLNNRLLQTLFADKNAYEWR